MRPRIRSLKPEMWDDERIVALSRDARLLLLGLITMADDEGRFRARRSTIHGHIMSGDDDALELIDGWIAEIREQGIVLFYLADGTPYGAFRNWKKHQRINRPTESELPPPPDPKVVRRNRVPKKKRDSERSGSSNGDLTESSVRSHSSTRRRAFRSDLDPDPVVIELTERLAARVVENDPKAKPKPDGERWLTDMRLLLDDRAGDAGEIRRVLDWCQADSFWRCNILSPASLRKQFTQLVLKSKAAELGQVIEMRGRKESPGALLRAMNGEAS